MVLVFVLWVDFLAFDLLGLLFVCIFFGYLVVFDLFVMWLALVVWCVYMSLCGLWSFGLFNWSLIRLFCMICLFDFIEFYGYRLWMVVTVLGYGFGVCWRYFSDIDRGWFLIICCFFRCTGWTWTFIWWSWIVDTSGSYFGCLCFILVVWMVILDWWVLYGWFLLTCSLN